MKFRIGITPALARYGGPSDDEPDGFIDIGLPGLAGSWSLEGERLFVLFEDETGRAVEDDVSVSVRQSARREDRAAGGEHAGAPAASCGQIYLQGRGPELIHVEYMIEALRGEKTDPGRHPIYDDAVDLAVRRWIAENESEIAHAVRERAGEMR